MTKTEVLTMVAQLKAHEYSDAVMLRWLEELEQKIACEIHRKPMSTPAYASAAVGEQLSVPAPYDRVYWTYLLSMLDFVSGNKEGYELSHANFKEAYEDYARYVQRNNPFSKRRRLR